MFGWLRRVYDSVCGRIERKADAIEREANEIERARKAHKDYLEETDRMIQRADKLLSRDKRK